MVFDFLYAVESLSLICLAAWNILSPLKGFFLNFQGINLARIYGAKPQKVSCGVLGEAEID